MKVRGIDAYLIPSTDEYCNEYVPLQYKRLNWLTGFTGSNGIAVITSKNCHLYTDGRYILQATKELSNFEIIDISKFGVADIDAQIIGYDPMLHTHSFINKANDMFNNKHEFLPIDDNLVDLIWSDRPERKTGVYYQYDNNSYSRITKLTNAMHQDSDFMLISSAEQLCWLAGIRGDDVPYTPIALYYGILSKSGVLEKIGSAYALKQRIKDLDEYKIEFDPYQTPHKIASLIKNKIHSNNPINSIRVIKTDQEIATMKEAHIYDGAAICKFLYWLSNIESVYTEYELAEKLLEFRLQANSFDSLSFSTISAFQENGAIIHYNPNKLHSKKVEGDGLFLIDSGAHYKCGGTTDVTRVIPIGNISPDWRYYYTSVLKAHIDLALCRFPQGTTGAQLDGIARAALWNVGLDYPHGTGHGVGVFLSVHEGSLRISKACNIAVPKGAILSNEPGVYLEGKYGIRLENLMVSSEDEIEKFLKFSPLTMVPFDIRLIEVSMLSLTQRQWVNAYHKNVLENLIQHIDHNMKNWLSYACAEI